MVAKVEWHAGELFPVKGRGAEDNIIAVSPDGQTLAAVDWGGEIGLWDVSGNLSTVFRGSSTDVYCVAFSPDSRTLVSGNRDGTIHFWDVVSGDQTGELLPRLGTISSLAFSLDGTKLAVATSEGTRRIFQIAINAD